jgi:hypothetical protein
MLVHCPHEGVQSDRNELVSDIYELVVVLILTPGRVWNIRSSSYSTISVTNTVWGMVNA